MQNNLSDHGYFKITQNIFLLNNDNKFLVMQNESGKWLLPGGRLGSGENWLKGLQREIKEETGILKFTINFIFQTDTWEYKGDFYFGVFYVGKIDNTNIVLSPEHIGYKWINTVNEINSLDFWNESLRENVKFYKC
jgi:8-oxo-dGTP pyrophosphatase MutT (NUDIX family)